MVATELEFRKMTAQEFRNMELDEGDPYFYELINGILMKRNAPKPRHQRASRSLFRALDNFILDQQLGEIFYAPIDVELDKHNVPQPDLVFVANNSRAIVDADDAIIGSPDLVIEVVSPGSVKLDRITKKELYEQFAVKEYWIVDPKSQYVEIHTFENDRYRLHNLFDSKGQTITSPLLTGFSILFEKVFE